MTPKTLNYVDSDTSCDHSSEANVSIFQKIKIEKIWL